MKNFILLFIFPILIGCSSSISGIIDVSSDGNSDNNLRQAGDNRWIWGDYNFHINEAHSQINITPLRQAQHHYNVKTLLENGPCTNCIWITYLDNNGDGTINLGVALRHPYPGNDYFTGFDVRGIAIFPAHGGISAGLWIPLREAGDPELLNKDGYTWVYRVHNEKPIEPPLKRYQPGGKLGGGISWGYFGDHEAAYYPFKYYHSSENRRYFSSSAVLVRDYYIYIPPGEWDFGYSVDACWAPPLETPVTNVPDDFPLWANCMANYRLDAELTGEIDGDKPATLVVDVYNHSGPDAPGELWVDNGDLFPYEWIWVTSDPIDMGDHARWIVNIHNLTDAKPGWYLLGVRSYVKLDKYPGPIEGIETNSGAQQIVKVHVVS